MLTPAVEGRLLLALIAACVTVCHVSHDHWAFVSRVSSTSGSMKLALFLVGKYNAFIACLVLFRLPVSVCIIMTYRGNDI